MENALRPKQLKEFWSRNCSVLILIFLENALRPIEDGKGYLKSQVLILIFLENALRPLLAGGAQPGVNVLILIFLENALRQVVNQTTEVFPPGS